MFNGSKRTHIEPSVTPTRPALTSVGPSREQERASDRAKPSLLRTRFVQSASQNAAFGACRFVSRRAIVRLDPNPPIADRPGASVGGLLRGNIVLAGRRLLVPSRIHRLHARYSQHKEVDDRLVAASASGRFDVRPTRLADRAEDSPALLPSHAAARSRTARLGWTAVCKESAGLVLRGHAHLCPL